MQGCKTPSIKLRVNSYLQMKLRVAVSERSAETDGEHALTAEQVCVRVSVTSVHCARGALKYSSEVGWPAQCRCLCM